MKIHRSLAEAVIESLRTIFEDNKYADKVIEKVLKTNPKWGARDRRFIAETTYEIVRWKRLYQEVSKSAPHDYWSWLAAFIVEKKFEIPGWSEFSNINVKQIRTGFTEHHERKIKESIPDWLDEVGSKDLGERWDSELSALNQQAQVVIRVNTLKITKSELQITLRKEEVETSEVDHYPDSLIITKRQNIFKTQSFKDGLFEVMDAASQVIAPFLQVEPGMRIIDACAGGGGKTLHLSCLSNNKGRIVAMDTEAWKLEELMKRAKRAGAFNIETKVIDTSKVVKRLENSADRLLLDVPCSGMGVLKRNPDAKWKLSMEFINRVNELQRKILTDYSTMLKVGGKLVYSTCSILSQENESVVQEFIKAHPEFSIEEERRCWPSQGFDGFYMARLIKSKAS